VIFGWEVGFVPSYSVVAVVLLGFLAVLGYFWQQPLEMSETGRRRFRLGVLLSAASGALLAADFAIVISIDALDFNRWRSLVFFLAFSGFWVNGVALFSFLRPLWCALPFAKGDASDVTPAGITLGLAVFFMQVALTAFCVQCLFVP
jgi:hypothetical protein